MLSTLLLVLSVLAVNMVAVTMGSTHEQPVWGEEIKLQEGVQDVVKSPTPKSADALPTNFD